jgi:hypothetical protein
MATIVIYDSNLHDKIINTFNWDHSDFVGIAFVDCWVSENWFGIKSGAVDN